MLGQRRNVMNTRTILILLTLAALAAASLYGGLFGRAGSALGAPGPAGAPQSDPSGSSQAPEAAAAGALVMQYAAPFICQERLQPGTFFYGPKAPIVEEKSQVSIHNPNDFTITLYKKAVRSTLEDATAVQPGKWKQYQLGPDYAIRVDCDDIAVLLTGNPQATFIGTYGIGVTVRGFVVVGLGPQPVPGTTQSRYVPLDVSAEYTRNAEVMKKDIHFQPWWTWWWWSLPWKLGYPYHRLLAASAATGNSDCRELLFSQLEADVTREMPPGLEANATLSALRVGREYWPTNVTEMEAAMPPALVPMVGACDQLDAQNMSVSYVLVSNRTPLDPSPIIIPVPPAYAYPVPWLPGRWYDLPVVTPQNVDLDIDQFFRQFHAQMWVDAGAPLSDVNLAMPYYFPYWCGWGFWSGWRNNQSCVSVAVGDGESLDMEAVTPVRVIYSVWPPAGQ
jgi:hypothetical protein